MARRYTTLRILSAVYKLLGLLLALGSFLGFAGALYVAINRPDTLYPTNLTNGYLWVLVAGTALLFFGLLLALVTFGTGVMLDLYMSMEQHTRASAVYLRRLSQNRRRVEAPPASQTVHSPVRPAAPPIRPLEPLQPRPVPPPVYAASDINGIIPAYSQPAPLPPLPHAPSAFTLPIVSDEAVDIEGEP